MNGVHVLLKTLFIEEQLRQCNVMLRKFEAVKFSEP